MLVNTNKQLISLDVEATGVIAEWDGAIANPACPMVTVHKTTDGVAVTHTIGLMEKGWPELIVTGPPPMVAGSILHQLVHLMVERDKGAEAGEVFGGLFQEDKASLRTDPITEDAAFQFMTMARAYRIAKGGLEVDALQVVLSDKTGLWPDDASYDPEMKGVQTILARYYK